MTQTFRTTHRHWIEEVSSPTILGLLFLLMALYWRSGEIAFHSVVFLLITSYHLFKEGRRAWGAVLHVDERGLRGRVDKIDINLLWSDVVAAWQFEGPLKPKFLFILTRDYHVQVPLIFFDRARVWELVFGFLPPRVHVNSAYLSLPGYLPRRRQAPIYIARTRPLRVLEAPKKSRYFCLGSALFTLTFMACSIAYDAPDARCGVPFWGAMTLLALLLAVTQGTIEMDSGKILTATPLGRHALRWHEVQWVERDMEGALSFCAPGKWLTLSNPLSWEGTDKERMIDLMNFQIERLGLEVREVSQIALWKHSRNTRLSRKREEHVDDEPTIHWIKLEK